MTGKPTLLALAPLLIVVSACCSIPTSLEGYSYKVSASPEVLLPASAGKFFVPISISNDSADELCFEQTGQGNGLQAKLTVSISSGTRVKFESSDLSGLSGTRLKPGRSISGSNSPLNNVPIGFYVSIVDSGGATTTDLRWQLEVTSPRGSPEQRVIASGVSRVSVREPGSLYMLLAEQIPYPSKLAK